MTTQQIAQLNNESNKLINQVLQQFQNLLLPLQSKKVLRKDLKFVHKVQEEIIPIRLLINDFNEAHPDYLATMSVFSEYGKINVEIKVRFRSTHFDEYLRHVYVGTYDQESGELVKVIEPKLRTNFVDYKIIVEHDDKIKKLESQLYKLRNDRDQKLRGEIPC